MLMGMLFSGLHLGYKGYGPKELTDIFKRASQAQEQGVPLAKVLTEDELEALMSVGAKLAQMRANGEPLMKDPEAPRVLR